MHAARDIIVKCRKSFADEISRALSLSNITLTDLAARTGTSRAQLQRAIQGKATLEALTTVSDSLGYEVKIEMVPKHRVARHPA